jgi:hypothetical protein
MITPFDHSEDAVRAIESGAVAPARTHRIRPRINTANKGVAPAIRKAKLQYPELTNSQIAKRVGCDPSNVTRVLARFLGNNNTAQDLQDYKEHKGDIWDSVAMRAVMSIDDAKLHKSSASQLMMVAGIAFDKSQLVHGQATQINVSVLTNLLDEARAERDRQDRQMRTIQAIG